MRAQERDGPVLVVGVGELVFVQGFAVVIAERHACSHGIIYPLPARLRYSPLRVSTATISPMPMNGGTLIFRPVSNVAGLVCAAAVAPFTLGSVSTTFNSTVAGSSRLIGVPS